MLLAFVRTYKCFTNKCALLKETGALLSQVERHLHRKQYIYLSLSLFFYFFVYFDYCFEFSQLFLLNLVEVIIIFLKRSW